MVASLGERAMSLANSNIMTASLFLLTSGKPLHGRASWCGFQEVGRTVGNSRNEVKPSLGISEASHRTASASGEEERLFCGSIQEPCSHGIPLPARQGRDCDIGFLSLDLGLCLESILSSTACISPGLCILVFAFAFQILKFQLLGF